MLFKLYVIYISCAATLAHAQSSRHRPAGAIPSRRARKLHRCRASPANPVWRRSSHLASAADCDEDEHVGAGLLHARRRPRSGRERTAMPVTARSGCGRRVERRN